jgi:2-iminobutanoate/2-iminopropanoate deaminase
MNRFRITRSATSAATAALIMTLTYASVATAKPPAAAVEYFPMQNGPPGMTLPFSEAVRAGNMLYLSGMVGTDASGKLVAGGVKAETKQVMDNISASLARHGSSMDGLVQCQVALADIAEWPAFNEVYKGYFKTHFPSRMAYAASGLALNARVEVQCNAYVGS